MRINDLFSATVPSAPAPASRRLVPTAEQALALSMFASEPASMAINAYAGAGKTSTLKLIAASEAASRRRGMYLAFNKSIATEAQASFGQGVKCSTQHSLAYRAMVSKYGGIADKLTGRLNTFAIAQTLNIQRNFYVAGQGSLRDRQVGALISATIAKFCQSADASIATHHVALPERVKSWGPAAEAQVTQHIASQARLLWSRMIDPSNAAPLGHDGYLKLWASGVTSLPCDYMLLDEAQDSNPVILAALDRCALPVVYVGDRYQQIYSFRGAVDAMQKLSGRRTCYLTQSFRFGSDIAAWASRILVLLDETRPVIGAGAKGAVDVSDEMPVSDRLTILCRTNAVVIERLFGALLEGRKCHIVGGTAEILRMLDDAEALIAGTPGTLPEFFGFANWDEVREYVEEFGGELKPFVRIVDAHGVEALRRAVHSCEPHEATASVVLSTAHKAKGREWNDVCLADDFRITRETDDGVELESASELMLFYVASTRAKANLPLLDLFKRRCWRPNQSLRGAEFHGIKPRS